jgi:carbamate kinase
MRDAVVILVNGEVLASGRSSTIPDQFRNAETLTKALLPILCSNLQVAILHGNKPQVGFVLFRSELARHVLHHIPLDVCGADTQGATGYMLTQALLNVLHNQCINRQVMGVLTQTVVDQHDPRFHQPTKAIGPRFDRDKAQQHRQTLGWHIIEEPGFGYRRAVPAPPPIEIVGIAGIKQLVETGIIVVTAGGGGIPVIRTEEGHLKGVEVVVDTDQVACMLGKQLKAKVMLMIIEKDDKFVLSRLSTEENRQMSLQETEETLATKTFSSNMVRAKLQAAVDFIHSGSQQVIITTLRKLPSTLAGESGLRIGTVRSSMELFGE